MSFLGFGKRRRVPEELPDLISDELEKESTKEVSSYLKEEIKMENEKVKPVEKEEIQNKSFEVNKNVLNRLIKNVEETPERPMKKEEIQRKSFFNDFQENLSKELSDLNSLESFYNKKFMNRDILDDMKSYWEKQKTENILELLGKNFKDKIESKVKNLQEIERQWQEIYFELIEKEEEIKDAEQELKDLLKEFVQICKHKKETLEKRNGFKLRENYKDNEKQVKDKTQKQQK